jgi:putative ABC transport system permease protein
LPADASRGQPRAHQRKAIARTHSVFPDSTIGIYLGVVATVVVLTLATSLAAARRAIRTPAIEAVAV